MLFCICIFWGLLLPQSEQRPTNLGSRAPRASMLVGLEILVGLLVRGEASLLI